MELKRITRVPPWIIELVAILLFVAIAIAGYFLLRSIPSAEFTRSEMLRVLEVTFAAAAVVTLLLLWATLRHGATLNKLLAYHEYFHDLPSASKVASLQTQLTRLSLPIPLWHSPLGEAERQRLVADDPNLLALREYLNDFEEFCGAVNSGLVDEDYAYALECTRTLNAYYGFHVLIVEFGVEDRRKAALAGEEAPITGRYYWQLETVAERWKKRKLKEAQGMSRTEKRRIRKRL